MKRILALALAVTALSLVPDNSVQAQGYTNGYEFGAGVFAARRGNIYGDQRDQAPFFARHPPVYYSHVVKRPFGISPYPVPAGVMPVEMIVAPKPPVRITNPYFEPEIESPVDVNELEIHVMPSDLKPAVEEKTTWISNPYLISIANR